MPNVGGTEFPYTQAGIQKAKAWAEMTGKPMQMQKKYQQGGMPDLMDPKYAEHFKQGEIRDLDKIEDAEMEQIANLVMGTVGGTSNVLTNLKKLLKVAKGKKSDKRFIRYIEDRIKKVESGDISVHPDKISTPKPPSSGKSFDRLAQSAKGRKYNIGGVVGQPLMQKSLASKGRMGDTAIRNVAGRPSHVNPIEAGMIDKFGPAGQQFTQRAGSGTINPMTGLPEYWNPFKKAKKWWNKNIKPAGKQNLWEGIGTVAHALDPTGISGLATCLGQGKNYWDCVKYRGERDPFGKIKDKAAFPSPGQIMQNPNWASGVPGDVPLHTGLDVTEWGIDDPTDITQWGDLTDEQREYMEWAYGDDTAFVDSPPLPEEPSIEMPARKSPKFWGFEKFGKGKKGDLQKLVDELLGGRKGKQAAYGGKIPKYNIGGPVSTPMMAPSRRLYGQRPPVQQPVAQRRRRPRPVMQTSTRGMPVRGRGMDMQMGQPMYKKGGSVIPKGWHV